MHLTHLLVVQFIQFSMSIELFSMSLRFSAQILGSTDLVIHSARLLAGQLRIESS